MFLGFIYVIPGMKNPVLILNDNSYVVRRKYDNRTFWHCTRYQKTWCKSRLTTFGKTVRVTGQHNHPKVCPDQREAILQHVSIEYG